MILNRITDQEYWLPTLANLPGAKAPTSLPLLILHTRAAARLRA